MGIGEKVRQRHIDEWVNSTAEIAAAKLVLRMLETSEDPIRFKVPNPFRELSPDEYSRRLGGSSLLSLSGQLPLNSVEYDHEASRQMSSEILANTPRVYGPNMPEDVVLVFQRV